jgi:hypothetical protein
MSAVERFMVMFEPENNKIAFRVMLDEMVKEIKRKAEIDSEPLMMRDYFASKAMQSLIALCHKKFDVSKDKELIVQDAYEIADAMMKARNDS